MYGTSNNSTDSYEHLLTQWQARRDVVNAYHRALRFLASEGGVAARRQYGSRAELNAKLVDALGALHVASERLGRYERVAAGAR